MRLKRWLIALSVGVLCTCKNERPPPPPPSVPAETPKPSDPSAAPAPGKAKPADVPVEDPDESPFAWTIHSGDGRSKLKQKPGAPGKCYLECTGADGSKVWDSTADCFGEK